MKNLLIILFFFALFSFTYSTCSTFAQEITVEQWIEELKKMRERDLKADRKILSDGVELLGAKLLEPLEDLLQETPYGEMLSQSTSYIRNLGKEGHNVIPLLRICMQDYSLEGRKKALHILSTIYDQGENQKHYKEAFPDIAHILLYDWNAGTRSVCATLIGTLDAQEFTQALIQGLEDLNDDARGTIYKSLKKVSKCEELLFINQKKEWNAWFEKNKEKLPPQILPEKPQFLKESHEEVKVDLSTPENVLRSFVQCVAKGNPSALDQLWSKKEAKFSGNNPSADRIKEQEYADRLYYSQMFPLYQRLAQRLLKEKPTNTSEKEDTALFKLEPQERLDRTRKILIVKEYNAYEIAVQTGTGPADIELAKQKCQEALDFIELIVTHPDEIPHYFKQKSKEHALPDKNLEKHLNKYFVATEFDEAIKVWFQQAKPKDISPIFPRDRGASCFLYLGNDWKISTFEPHFTE